MLLLPLLCLSSFVTATPTLGTWSRMNIFTSVADQLPLRTIPDLVKGSPLEGLFMEDKQRKEETIWEIVSNDSKFSKLTKAIKFADAVDYFNDKDADVTFFATPDWALPHRDHDHGCDLSQIDELSESNITPFVLNQHCHWDDVMSAVDSEDLDRSLLFDDKEERRKKVFRLLIRAILAYESLPQANDIYALGENTTHATMLAIPGVLEGEPLRMRVEQKLLPPSTHVNFYAKVVYPDVKASNGIIHVVNHPVLPPLSAFQTLFMIPDHFSILSSAIQRVGLTHDVDLRFAHKHEKDSKGGRELVGTSSLTLFAPVNRAFDRLPLKLKYFLFSPLGHHILRKMLEYHIVPGIIVHSDYQFNKSAHAASHYVNKDHARYLSHTLGEVISNRHIHLPTLFDNRTVHAHITRVEVTLPVPGPNKPTVTKTDFSANSRDVLIRDLVANNAAVHVVDHLLDPRRHRHHHECHDNSYQKDLGDDDYDASWEDWENWLVQWANSA